METVIAFTTKNIDKTIEQGGCGYWKLNAKRVKKCTYVLLAANSLHRDSSHPKNLHRYGFLIAKVLDVKKHNYDDIEKKESARWVIQFSEYAEINIPNLWGGFQNPIKYTNLDELNINVSNINWKPFPVSTTEEATDIKIPPLTINEAKVGISKKLDIPTDCIEITIKA